MRIFYALNQLTKNTIYANLNIEKLSNSVGGWIYLGKEKNITLDDKTLYKDKKLKKSEDMPILENLYPKFTIFLFSQNFLNQEQK